MPAYEQKKAPARLQPVKPDAQRQRPVTRAFPGNMEILTEHGFYTFEDLSNPQLLGAEVAHAGHWTPQTWKARELPYTLYTPGDDFPRVASVNPVSGEIVYVKPTLFRSFVYDDWLCHVKLKGVDILLTRYADLWLRGRYGRGWKFLLADNVSRNKVESAYWVMVDKFNQDLYGEYAPREGLVARLDAPITVRPQHAGWQRIDDLYPLYTQDESGRRVRVDRVRNEVDVFNVDVEPYHTVVVRRGRKDSNPRTPWIGNPVVVGDGSDKSVARVNSILALGERKVG